MRCQVSITRFGQLFQQLGAIGSGIYAVTGRGDPEQINGIAVASKYFSVGASSPFGV